MFIRPQRSRLSTNALYALTTLSILKIGVTLGGNSEYTSNFL